MDTAIIVAIVALVSTIVGATIGAATTYVLAARRERVDRETESRNHAIEAKRAARLLDLELNKAQALAELSIRKRYWVQDVVLSTEAWQKYGSVIAPDLSNVAWRAVAIAFLGVEHIDGARAFYQAGVLHDSPISDDMAGTIAPMVTDVTLGREALAPFVYGDDPHFREAVGPMVEQAPTVVKAYADISMPNIWPRRRCVCRTKLERRLRSNKCYPLTTPPRGDFQMKASACRLPRTCFGNMWVN